MTKTLEGSIPEVLQSRLRPVLSRRGGLALGVWGEAGSGKTHTLHHLLRQTPCRSFSFQATTPIAKLVQTLPKSPKLPLWAESLIEKLSQGEPLDGGRTAEAVGALLATLAPVVLHLEDIHEAYTRQLEFIQALAQIATKQKGLGLLVTSREPPPEGFEALRLGPLSEATVRAMLEGEVKAPLPAEALEWIGARAGGNPLYSLEFFRFLARQGFVWNDGQRWRWREPERRLMPASVEALIERALHEAARTPELEQALAAKAVLGPGREALWAGVLGLTPEALVALTQPLEDGGVLRGGEFAHPLYREVLRQNLSPERRRVLARSALEQLRDDPPAAAEFVGEAGLESPQALEVLTAAAQAAGNPLQAAHFKAQAVEHARGGERAKLALEAAQGLRRADLEEAARLAELAALETALSEAAGVLSAELLAVQGRLEEAEQRLERAGVGEAEQELLRLTLRATARDFVGAAELWRQSPTLRDSDDPRVSQAVVPSLLNTNRHEEARPVLTRALAQPNLSLADQLALEGFEVNLLYFDGQTEAAITRWAERVPQLIAIGDLRGAARALHNQGAAHQALGRIREAVEPHQRCARLYAQTGDLRAYANALSDCAWNLWHLAEYPEAETLFLQSRDLLRRTAPSDHLVECEGCLSLLYLDWSPPLAADLADKHASAALETARLLGNPYDIVASLYDKALARLRLGKPQEALEITEEMIHLCATHSLKGLGITARYCRALALEALGQKEEALELMRSTEADHQGGQTFKHKIGIEVARMSGDLELARRHLEWFRTNQMFSGVEVLRRYFPELQTSGQPTLPEEPLMRLEVLGPIRMFRQGAELPLRGQKRRELLAVLLDARLGGRSEVARLDLLETLYPGSDEAQASTGLKDMVYQVRELCGPQTIQTTEGGYALGAVATDVEEFLHDGDTRLWRGPYLEGFGLDGSSVYQTLHQALYARTETLLESDPVEAARLGQLLLEADPYAPEPLRLTLTALRANKNHKALTRTYTRARERMSEVGETLPENWAEFLAQQPA